MQRIERSVRGYESYFKVSLYVIMPKYEYRNYCSCKRLYQAILEGKIRKEWSVLLLLLPHKHSSEVGLSCCYLEMFYLTNALKRMRN